MNGDLWRFDQSDGELLLRTGVTGRAARMGHRLTIAMTRWRAEVRWGGDRPTAAELVVEVDSLEVRHGEGGVKGLSGPEKSVARSNALRSLSAGRYPEIQFTADRITEAPDAPGGYRLHGALRIRGKERDHVIDVGTKDLGASWRMTAESTVCQTDYGIKPFALLMGSVQVADEVAVSWAASVRAPGAA